MAEVTMREMLEAGVHFGHQTRFWNPRMAPYIFGERNKIHIINLEKSLPLYEESVNFLRRMAANRGTILFVGTKRAAQAAVSREATRCGMPFVDRRWLGGMLTNFRTVKNSIRRLRDYETLIDEGGLDRLSKKEGLALQREASKLNRSLGGIRYMDGIPDVIFIIDVGHEKIAVAEAVKLAIPVVGVVDTNNTPEGVDYVIPGNDDAIRSIEIYLRGAADAVIEGRMSAQLPIGPERDEEAPSAAPSGTRAAQGRQRAGSDAAAGADVPGEPGGETSAPAPDALVEVPPGGREGAEAPPRSDDFRKGLQAQLHREEEPGRPHVDVNAGELHRQVGGYPGPDHRMPLCCQVMRSEMAAGDQVMDGPPGGEGASLTIRYRLPRVSAPEEPAPTVRKKLSRRTITRKTAGEAPGEPAEHAAGATGPQPSD